jgi:hypothetical protein
LLAKPNEVRQELGAAIFDQPIDDMPIDLVEFQKQDFLFRRHLLFSHYPCPGEHARATLITGGAPHESPISLLMP